MVLLAFEGGKELLFLTKLVQQAQRFPLIRGMPCPKLY
jgi:hypothetical protein